MRHCYLPLSGSAGTLSLGWDYFDQPSSEQGPLGSVTYAIDDAGRLESVAVTGVANPTVYGYDTSNRVTSVTSGAQAVGIS